MSASAAAIAADSASTIASMSRVETLRVIAMRSRAVPCGTVGGRMPRMSKPSACSMAAIRIVRALSPMTTGMIWLPLGAMPSAASRLKAASAG